MVCADGWSLGAIIGGVSETVVRDERAQFATDEKSGVPETFADNAAIAVAHSDDRSSHLVPGRYGARALAVLRRNVEREAARGTGFLWIPVLIGAGALCYFSLPVEPPFYALSSGLAVLVAARFAAGRHPLVAAILLAGIVFLLGVVAGKVETWRFSTPMLGSAVSTQITGRVVAIEPRADGRVRLTITLETTAHPTLRYPPKRARLSARTIPDRLRAGDGVSGTVRLMPPSGPVRPQAYDFSFESYFDGIGAVGFFLRGPQQTELATPPSLRERMAVWLQGFREMFATRLKTRVTGAEGEVAAALITGMRGGIPETVQEALRRSGLAHVLAISGLHMALVAVTVMGSIRLGFAFFPGFCARHPVKKYAAASALAVSFLYLFVSGAAVAAQRSFIMLAIMLVALLFDRAALTMRNLALAALVVLAVAPHEIVGPGFQMSFVATAALIAGYAMWNARRQRALSRKPVNGAQTLPMKIVQTVLFYVAGLLLTSLIAGTATALYGAWHFQRASPLALAANLAAMPLVSLVVMPSAVVSVLAMPFNLDALPLAVMGWGIAQVIAVADWFSARTPFDATGLLPLPATLLLTGALVLATMVTSRLRLLALPLLASGVLLLVVRDLPDALISEDARLVGVRVADGMLGVNRDRPSGFTTQNWLRALRSQTVRKPDRVSKGLPALPEAGAGFICEGPVCLARDPSGGVIAHVAGPLKGVGSGPNWNRLCAIAQLLVIEDASRRNPCPERKVTVVTGRDLARHGSAAVWFSSEGPDDPVKVLIDFAVHEPYRPWHAQRQFSREARGLAPRRSAAR